MISRYSLLCSLSLAVSISAASPQSVAQTDRWPAQKANEWYKQQPWLVGADYIPSNAINELEMFQAATFDPAINDKELGMAESIGMNTVRVFPGSALAAGRGGVQAAARYIPWDCCEASHQTVGGAF